MSQSLQINSWKQHTRAALWLWRSLPYFAAYAKRTNESCAFCTCETKHKMLKLAERSWWQASTCCWCVVAMIRITASPQNTANKWGIFHSSGGIHSVCIFVLLYTLHTQSCTLNAFTTSHLLILQSVSNVKKLSCKTWWAVINTVF